MLQQVGIGAWCWSRVAHLGAVVADAAMAARRARRCVQAGPGRLTEVTSQNGWSNTTGPRERGTQLLSFVKLQSMETAPEEFLQDPRTSVAAGVT